VSVSTCLVANISMEKDANLFTSISNKLKSQMLKFFKDRNGCGLFFRIILLIKILKVWDKYKIGENKIYNKIKSDKTNLE
jgi:hypothetical protein